MSELDPTQGVADPADLPMPAGTGLGPPAATETLPAPPSFGKQMAQLVVIPAAIVIAAVGIALLFGKLASSRETLEDQLLRLRQSSGAGRMAFDLQDPRYKDRSQAAFNVATIIPTLKDPAERHRVSQQLVEVLDHYVEPQEDMLNMYLLLAIGQLGQPEGLDAILKRFESQQVMTREGAVRGVLAWTQSTPTGQPDAAGDSEWVAQREAGRVRAMPHLIKATSDTSPLVASEASAAIGELAERGDAAAIEGLKGALQTLGPESREVHWNAGVALARLGDEQGAGIVADVLLNRGALSQMSAGESGPAREQRMPPELQDRVILSTLAAAPDMTDERVWIRIQQLADGDPNPKVQSAASQMMFQRKVESTADERR